jgi:hypothetical protein
VNIKYCLEADTGILADHPPESTGRVQAHPVREQVVADNRRERVGQWFDRFGMLVRDTIEYVHGVCLSRKPFFNIGREPRDGVGHVLREFGRDVRETVRGLTSELRRGRFEVGNDYGHERRYRRWLPLADRLKDAERLARCLGVNPEFETERNLLQRAIIELGGEKGPVFDESLNPEHVAQHTAALEWV